VLGPRMSFAVLFFQQQKILAAVHRFFDMTAIGTDVTLDGDHAHDSIADHKMRMFGRHDREGEQSVDAQAIHVTCMCILL
jgi:hypothetical protein